MQQIGGGTTFGVAGAEAVSAQKLIPAKRQPLMITGDCYGPSPLADMMSYAYAQVQFEIYLAQLTGLRARLERVPTLKRTAVESSNVVSVGYDAASRVLEVEFNGGSVYQYADVPADTHKRLMEAPSVGSFLAKEIKPRYAVTKVG